MAVPELSMLLGKMVLVGITYVDAAGKVTSEVQLAGLVTAVDPLISIDCGRDGPLTLPPDPQAFDAAEPGDYRLRTTGAVVVDPDFTSTWTVTAPS